MGAGKTLKGGQQNLQFLDRQMTIDTYEYTIIYIQCGAFQVISRFVFTP